MCKLFIYRQKYYWCLWVCVISLFSCTSVRDVTNEDKYHLGYKPNEVYLIKQKLFLVKYENVALSAPQKHGIPDFEVYHRAPNKWPDIVGWIDAGTKIKIIRLIEKTTFEAKNLWAFARIMNGKHQGQEVMINFVSSRIRKLPHGYPSIDKYDPDYLELIAEQ